MSTVKPAFEEYTISAPKKPNRGILKVRVKFTDTGRVYDVVLIEKDTAMSLVDSSNSSFLAVPGMIIVDEATIEKMKAIIGELIDDGFFDHLVPVE